MHGKEGQRVGFWGRRSVEKPRDQRHLQQQYLNAFCLPLHRKAVKHWASLASLSSLFLPQKIPAQLCPCLQLICIISTCCLSNNSPFLCSCIHVPCSAPAVLACSKQALYCPTGVQRNKGHRKSVSQGVEG